MIFVLTKHANNKDILLKIILNVKQLQSSDHSYNSKEVEKQYYWDNFQNDSPPKPPPGNDKTLTANQNSY